MEVTVIVVENFATETCRTIVEDAAAASPFDVRYVHQPDIGIPQARNAALSAALPLSPKWIGFIDDDEEIDPGWFEAAATAIATLEADVITGPVRENAGQPTPYWLANRKPRRPTGQVLGNAATNNTLAKVHIFSPEGMGLRFNEALRFTGCSDSELFGKANRAGARIVWCAEMSVTETWSNVRTSLRWQLRRKFRNSNGAVHIETRSASQRAMRFLRALPKIPTALGLGAAALIVFPGSRDRSKRLGYKATVKLVEVAAIAAAVVGIRSQPYRSVDH